MNIRRFSFTSFLVFLFAYAVLYAPLAHAEEGLQLRPLMYHETLTPGQIKRGVLDIANPTKATLSLHVSVKLFRQANNDGQLEFYDKPDVTAGIKPEYTNFDLEGKSVLRLSFTVDSSKLPQGDIFAVILATTQPQATDKQAILPAVQVGTLLILQNGDAGPRHAQISSLSVPLVQMGGSSIHGTASISNPANTNQPTGFFPQMKVVVSPWGATTQFEGPLVYAGRTRTFDFSAPSNQFGIYKVTVTANNATAERYVFVMTGKWVIIVPVVVGGLIALIVVAVWIWKRRRKRIGYKL